MIRRHDGVRTRLGAFAVLETHTETPLLTIRRLGDHAVGGGLFLMLAAAGSIFGLFYFCSVYLQDVLGTSPLMTGLAFIPLALAAGVGAHAAGHVVGRHGVRVPLASAFAIATVGMALLAPWGAETRSHVPIWLICSGIEVMHPTGPKGVFGRRLSHASDEGMAPKAIRPLARFTPDGPGSAGSRCRT
jgi:predicted MFS family arabinose efflux permease